MAAPQQDRTESLADEREVVVRVEGLTAAFGDEVILHDVSFRIRAGEVFVILGGSGSGKSVLLRHIIGLMEPAAGRVELNGTDLATVAGAKRHALLRRVGVAYQSGALFGSMTLFENVRLPLVEFTDLPPEAMDHIARMKLARVGLDPFGHLMPSELSGGMQKRAAIARAMVLDPKILFLDEPSAGLDPVTSVELDQLILRLARSLGITFVLVSHELPSIFMVADRCVMLDKDARTIVARGRPTDLRESTDDPAVRRFFNRMPREAKR